MYALVALIMSMFTMEPAESDSNTDQGQTYNGWLIGIVCVLAAIALLIFIVNHIDTKP